MCVQLETFTFTESDFIEDVRSELELNSFGTECILFLQGTLLDWTPRVLGTVRRLEAVRLCRELFQYCLIIVGRT